METQVSWIFEAQVKDGQIDAFKALVGEMVTATEAEPGALSYEFFADDDGAVHIYERYADSDAVLAHIGGFGANFAERFLGMVEPQRVSVYGEVSDEARAALAAFGAVHYGTVGGFAR
jgi:quinol monooxygenase YgiN